ncbi:MAG TPA: thioredoxin domain-containing protein [Pyrinomonadaceae bacterium]
MTISKWPLLFALLLVIAINVNPTSAQRRRGTRPATTPAATQPQPTPQTTPVPASTPSAPRQPIQLAIVNGQTITTAGIDRRVGELIETLEDRLAEAREQVLQMEINTALLAAEARKRNVQTQQLYEVEVTRRVGEPSDAEITKFLEDNRDEFGMSTDASARAQVVSYLKADREERLAAELVKRLRTANPVVMGASLKTPNLAPATVIATVGGRQITVGAVGERLKPIIYRLRLEAYELQKKELEQTINDMLLLAEANRQNVPPEQIVRQEISDKVRPPSEADVAKFYNDNKSRINGDLDSVRNQVASYLRQQEEQKLEQALAERLRRGAEIRFLLTEPVPPVQVISVDDDPVKGSPTAQVTIVEFTDYQCPSCAAMHPILEEALKTYAGKVKLVVRDYPLSNHANARKAAEAANAAHAQGKYFEYAALLYQKQKALDVPSLKKYASDLGLDRVRFDAALDKGTFAAEVRNDMNDGEIYGVESTPTIFVNGVMLKTLSAESLKESIDRALAASAPKSGN